MIEIVNISFSYLNSDRKILDHLDGKFERGHLYSIMGSSGTGKTTLLRIVSGILAPQEGMIRIDGENVDGSAIRKNRMAYISQDYLLFPYMNAIDNLVIAMDIFFPDRSREENKEEAKRILLKVGISGEEQKRRTENLSGGEKQRIAIARALALKANYILADEPTGNLDSQNAEIIIKHLKEIASKQNACILLVTHSRETADKADVVYEMKEEKLQIIRDEKDDQESMV